MEPYYHKVSYYETDRMGVTHHSNYIRWMEEARVDYLNKIGVSYARLEEEGLVSPVVGLSCSYLRSTTFDDTVRIVVRLDSYRGVRFAFSYEMFLPDQPSPVFTASSTHCFLDQAGKPVMVRHHNPKLDALFKAQLKEGRE